MPKLQIFQAQMMQLNPDLGFLPAGMNFRINPDPTKPSQGIMIMRDGPSAGTAYMSSSFALRLQLTTDGGATWQDSSQFTHMNLRILPGTGFRPPPPTGRRSASACLKSWWTRISPSSLPPPRHTSSYYPGYGGTNSGILTSPVMFDSATMIGESVAHVRDSVSPTYFPVAAGTGWRIIRPPIHLTATF